METVFSSMGDALTSVTGWIGDVLASLISAEGALHELWPLAMVGVAFALVGKGISMIKEFTWGF